MLWPADKFLTLPSGMFECRDCHLVTVTLSDANPHNCERGMELNKRVPKPVVSKPVVVKPVEPEKKLVSDLGQFA